MSLTSVESHVEPNAETVNSLQAMETAMTAQSQYSAYLHRHLCQRFLSLSSAKGNYLTLNNGQSIFDASGGAAVACIGHGDVRVIEAVTKQVREAAYCSTLFFTTVICEELCQLLIKSTKGHMAKAYLVSSGSEAMEAAIKLARQFFLEKCPPEPRRTRFISRNQSYHGTTLGSLSLGGHKYRREKFEPMLLGNITKVSPCFAYRNQKHTESDDEYVMRLAYELDAEFQRLGPETVCAFVAEPVVGAALGCVPALPGYFQAVQEVCQRYGALLILDEVMCGMGRTGTIHAWEQEGVVPDIQTIGKCLGGGYQPIAGVLANHRVIDVFERGTASFVHGHTYQGHPVACAAAFEVQSIIQVDDLLTNVRKMGVLLSEMLSTRIGDHPNVGDIRGRGLFWGIEFVLEKAQSTPFPPEAHVAMGICEMGLTDTYSIALYPGSGTAGGVEGDHIIIAPPYNISQVDVEFIVETVSRLIENFFISSEQVTCPK